MGIKERIKEDIDKEIAWCKDKNNQKKSKVLGKNAKWFIKGLEQAKRIIDSEE